MGQIFLGIDPGIGRTGFGVIVEDAGKIAPVNYGCITTPVNSPLPGRLAQLFTELEEVVTKYQPNYVCVEELFFSKNVKTALQVGHARGVILLVATQHDIPIFEFKPGEVKQAITGYGSADKKQIQQMMKALLGLKELPQPDDAADALAIAWCGASTYKLRRLTQ